MPSIVIEPGRPQRFMEASAGRTARLVGLHRLAVYAFKIRVRDAILDGINAALTIAGSVSEVAKVSCVEGPRPTSSPRHKSRGTWTLSRRVHRE